MRKDNQMYIYCFKSILFQGEIRKIISNFPILDKGLLKKLANDGFNYPEDRQWEPVQFDYCY